MVGFRPMGNYVIGLGNYVIATGLAAGILVIADPHLNLREPHRLLRLQHRNLRHRLTRPGQIKRCRGFAQASVHFSLIPSYRVC